MHSTNYAPALDKYAYLHNEVSIDKTLIQYVSFMQNFTILTFDNPFDHCATCDR